jgi:hypothetical protein
MDANAIIDALGGTAEVARLCRVKPPSVSEWRTNGIPTARLLYLQLLRPDLFQRDEAPDIEGRASAQPDEEAA